MSRPSLRLPAAILLGLALLGAPVSAQPSAARERPESLPPDCLAAGAISDPGAVLQQAGNILSALSGQPAGASLRADLGARIRNPELAGVDLSAPVRFFYMNPKVFPRPWVYQFGVTDADALKRALASKGPEVQEGEVALRLEGRQATWSLDAKAAERLIQWEKGGGKPLDSRAGGLPAVRVAGQIQARLDVQSFLREFAAQLLLMKGRAREALQRGGPSDPEIEKEISAVQAQLDSAAMALRQVRDVDFALEFAPAFVRVELDARLGNSAPLAALFRAQAPGDVELLGLCPPEASVAVVNNLSFMKAAGRMFLYMAGLPSPDESGQRGGSGHRAVALFLPPRSGEDTAAPPRVEILDLRDGGQAAEARREWDRLAREAPGPAIPGQAGGEPFSLHPIKAGEPAPAGVRLAEVVPNEAALQPKGVAVFRRFLGVRVEAAQEDRGNVCVTAIGGGAVERVRQAKALAKAKKGSSLASRCFQESIASLPEKPNGLVYVSPDALRRWFALAGRISSEPIPADATGLAAAVTMDGHGARFILNFPTAAIPGAQ